MSVMPLEKKKKEKEKKGKGRKRKRKKNRKKKGNSIYKKNFKIVIKGKRNGSFFFISFGREDQKVEK